MLDAVAKPLDAEDRRLSEERRKVLLAAMDICFDPKGAQSELHRQIVSAGERRLALPTVNKWCRGKSPITELTLRGILTVLGFPPTWKPKDGRPASWRMPSP